MRPSSIVKLILLFIVASFAIAKASATIYYINASGNDAAAGTLAAPWQTISKLNSSMAAMASTDTIKFNRGNSFFGAIIITKSGLTFDAYGTGENPIISGFVAVTGWTDIGAGKFQSAVTTAKASASILTINSTIYAPAKSPNSGYWTYTSGTSSSITSASIASTSYIGGEIIYRPNMYWMLKAKITGQSSNTVNFISTGTADPTGTGLSLIAGKADYGFYIQKHSSCIDQYGEWIIDSATKRVTIFGDLTGATVKISAIDTLVRAGSYTGLTFKNLNFEGAGFAAIHTSLGNAVTVSNCSFSNTVFGVYGYNTGSISVVDNVFSNTFCQAIGIANRQRENVTVTGNQITNNGMISGIGVLNYNMQLKAISVETDSDRVANTSLIQLNRIDSVGSAGIEIQGSNILVNQNSVKNFCNVISDHGGIYTFRHNASSTPSKSFSNRRITNNIIINSTGAPAGTKDNLPDVAGIYLDDFTDSVIVSSNTIADLPGNGIQANNVQSVSITDNKVLNCTYAINVKKKPYTNITNLRITRNYLLPSNVNQYNFLYDDDNIALPSPKTIAQSLASFGVVDSNYINTPRSQGFKYTYISNDTFYSPTALTLSGWQAYGYDVASSTIATGYQLFANTSTVVQSASIPGTWADISGNTYSAGLKSIAPGEAILLRQLSSTINTQLIECNCTIKQIGE